MKRDWRLLASVSLLITSAILEIIHSNRVAWWMMAWGGHDDETMQKEFGVMPPTNCAFDCYGWGTYPGDYFWLPAVISFLTAIFLIMWTWWKPKI